MFHLSKISRPVFWCSISVGFLLSAALSFHSVQVVRDELQTYDKSQDGLLLPDASWESVRLTTMDRLNLAAWYSPSQNGQTIILLHGFRGNRSQVLSVAKMLQREGFGVFTYDTRGHGQSDGNEIGYGENEKQDLKAALDWLEVRGEVDVARIGVYAFSLGGYIALQQAAVDPRIASLVLTNTPSTIFEMAVDLGGGGLKGFFDGSLRYIAAKAAGLSRYDYSGLEAIKTLKGRPVLLIASELDTVVPPKRMQELFEASPYPKALAILTNASHDSMETAQARRLERLVRNHFRRSLDKNRVVSGH